MKFRLDQSAANVREGLELLLEERGHELGTEGESTAVREQPVICWEQEGEHEISVSLKHGVLTIRCREKVHFFRGFMKALEYLETHGADCLLYTSPSPRD